MTESKAPSFSIVIPTYSRPEQLAVCLQACARIEYPRDRVEVIVVDDGGTKPLDEIVAGFHGKLTLKLLQQENSGPASARNRGASEAAGEFLAFTDDDCAPASDWLKALGRECVASPDCAVGGRTVNALTGNVYSTASQLLISYLLSFYNASPHDARFFPSGNLAFPTKQFRAVGGFDVTYPRAAAEDRELCDRWLHLGHRMIYASEAVVYHAHALTFRTFLRQHFHYGQGAFCFHRVRARRLQDRVKVEPLMFYINMLRYPFVSAQGVQAPLLMLLLVVTQVANAAGFFWMRLKGAAGD
ncbi:MAG: glycosyltransferase [Nitrospira sp.]|nr:glycosyltransferase [Nitrospira sp.]